MILRALAFAAAGATLVLASGASAEDADWYRGGWRTDGGEPHVYQFVIAGAKVSGVYCTHCADATTLAPIEGTFEPDGGIAFPIRKRCRPRSIPPCIAEKPPAPDENSSRELTRPARAIAAEPACRDARQCLIVALHARAEHRLFRSRNPAHGE